MWKSIGPNADVALAALRNLQHDLEGRRLGRQTDLPVLQPLSDRELPARRPLAEATRAYLDEVRQFRSPKTIAACENMLVRFLARYPDKWVEDITRKELLDHMFGLRNEGLGDRSIFNHIARITTLLKANGIPRLLRPADMPRYDEKEVRAYNTDELAIPSAAASADERLLFHFFLGTGFRDGEVMHCTWSNVDFKGKVISARSKPEMGFKLKDHEERSVSVPDALIQSLRTLRRLAFRAGLNCGECVTKAGEDCGDHPVRTYWGLHSFRRTFATFHGDAGISPRKFRSGSGTRTWRPRFATWRSPNSGRNAPGLR